MVRGCELLSLHPNKDIRLAQIRLAGGNMRPRISLIPPLAMILVVLTLTYAQEGPKVRGSKVVASGENHFMALSFKKGDKPVTDASFWRLIYTPVGRGHVCYVTSDLTGDGPSSDDMRALFTDNEALADYLNKEVMAAFDKSYIENPFPKYKASFETRGDTLNEYREIIRSDQYTIELVWRDFYPPILLDIPIKPFSLTTMLIPAKVAEVYINGNKAVGRVFPRPEGTAQGSTGSLAFSETWVK